ncbi:MAG: M20/M25/M40 family metallo-hydrolase [Polaribacter sp.]|uniref:M20/M25/M40 family metallo-hydrolase n=1 Tax=Polaribacter sp. TaxID=1920175 RepID=UPI002F35C23A
MKKINLIYVLFFAIIFSCKENTKQTTVKEVTIADIDTTTVRKHLYTLASDEMEGRGTGTQGIEKAAQYIESKFKKFGLKTYDTLNNYRQTFTFTNRQTKKEITASNIIGVLEGKSKKDEYVVVSAHYDHLGIRNKEGQLDSIYNGADDDASGTTAVLALAEYFSKKKINERTILFIAFTGEEMGLIGSNHFGKGIDSTKFVAGINIEMIGKESNYGPKTAWLTGFNRSDFGTIIQKNLEGSGYVLHPDPFQKFNLFFRSDNASLARLGIPAHTFSTGPIDVDIHYHKASDEPETLNVSNITETIRAIAIGTESIIKGEDTPTRVVLTVEEMTGRRKKKK